jgi:signal transduction histidine kinase
MLNQSELEQLILNLMTNARDAMSGGSGGAGASGGGRLLVSAAIDGSMVRVEVCDNGCGIPEEHLPHVQDPFFTTKAHGTGLGLSICRSIVWRSHGDLRIESEVGKGTRVLLALPTATEDQSDKQGDPIVAVPTIVVEDVVDTRANPRGG